MNILLDTVTFYRLTMAESRLSKKAIVLCKDPKNTLYLSAISATEMSIKHASGKFCLPNLPSIFIPEERLRHGILPLPLDEESATLLATLPLQHKDPFDRLLICQALAHDLTILTPDTHIRSYKGKTVW